MTSTGERLLVNFFYAPPVGHAVEALHYCLGHHLADPTRQVAVALNALFPGLRDYYKTSDQLLRATRGRSYVGSRLPGYVSHYQLRFELPESARAAAARRLAPSAGGSGAGRIAIMPAGSGQRSQYPSARSWLLILDALADAFPEIQIALIGKHTRDTRTTTSLAPSELAALVAHRTQPLDCFDIGLAEQLAVTEACDLFLAPHTGFGMAALAVGTPWLALSGGRWFEYFFNRVPFRSIIPDCERYPSFTQFAPGLVVDDDGDGARTPSMTGARVRDDLDRLIASAREMLDGSLSYERSLRDYFSDLTAAHGGDTSAIWSIDGVHLEYVP